MELTLRAIPVVLLTRHVACQLFRSGAGSILCEQKSECKRRHNAATGFWAGVARLQAPVRDLVIHYRISQANPEGDSSVT